MGIYSTKRITRKRAIACLINGIHQATDKQLEDLLFTVFADKTLNNYIVTSEEEVESDLDTP